MSLSTLLRYHIATPGQPEPSPGPGITWITGANHIYKRGQNQYCTVLVPVELLANTIPGLINLAPRVRWHHYPQRLPGQLLAAILTHARKAGSWNGNQWRPIETQYHITLEETERLRVRVPTQEGNAGRVFYQLPQDVPVLLDLHSHHGMPAFYSATDNRDDTGLGVAAVIGRIYTMPEITVRLCCYGHHWIIPATAIFDSLPGFRDTYSYGDLHDITTPRHHH